MKQVSTLTACAAAVSTFMAFHGVAAAQTAPAPTAAAPTADSCPNGWVRGDDGDCDPPKGEVLGFNIAGMNKAHLAQADTTASPATPPVPEPVKATKVASVTPVHHAHHRFFGNHHRDATILANFSIGSADAGTLGRDHVKSFVDKLNTAKLNGQHVIVNGHTDAHGSRRLNMRLSRQRAEAVKALLISAGLSENAVEIRGHGYDELLRPRQPFAAANRRVDVVLVKD